jgi:hypothetical protein
MYFAETISVFIASIFSRAVTDGFMIVSPLA